MDAGLHIAAFDINIDGSPVQISSRHNRVYEAFRKYYNWLACPMTTAPSVVLTE